MILVLKYYKFNVTIAYHQLQSQKHWPLVEKPSERWISKKPAEKTVFFALHVCMYASVCFELQTYFTFLKSSLYNEVAVLAREVNILE